jgi:hypothetical protein
MSVKPKRQVFGIVVRVSRVMGLILIALAILGLPQMRFLTGRLAASFGLIMSVALGLAGVAWLIGVQVFLHFLIDTCLAISPGSAILLANSFGVRPGSPMRPIPAALRVLIQRNVKSRKKNMKRYFGLACMGTTMGTRVAPSGDFFGTSHSTQSNPSLNLPNSHALNNSVGLS